jgi:hypothetical protein
LGIGGGGEAQDPRKGPVSPQSFLPGHFLLWIELQLQQRWMIAGGGLTSMQAFGDDKSWACI